MLLTILSYFLRSYRWLFLFPERTLSLLNSYKALILGFFMNNILPARTGELVRAHVGARVANQKRTLVLATVASERLADGLMLSLMFLVLGLGSASQDVSKNLLWVAALFGVVAIGVLVTLTLRKPLFALVDKLAARSQHRGTAYAVNRFQIFIDGLSPLFNWSRIPFISIGSLIIWLVELAVYFMIAEAYQQPLSLSQSVLFLVTVNFSSLIPAAPGGIGVIEGIATLVLVSLGVPKEIALSMVISQHLIQYLVVGIPGAYVMFTWKQEIKEVEQPGQEDA